MGSSTTMKLLVLSALVAAVSAGILGHRSPSPANGGGYSYGGNFGNGPVGGFGVPAAGCREGQILHVDGNCVEPIVTKNVFVYDVPQQQQPSGPPPVIPPPRVEENILFVRLPEGGAGPEPIVIPPPRQNNIVYILNKNDGLGEQRVIEVEAPPPSNPEVILVNYQEGENPILPIGVDLQTALNAATATGGQTIP